MAVRQLFPVADQKEFALEAPSHYLEASQDANDTIETLRAYPGIEKVDKLGL